MIESYAPVVSGLSSFVVLHGQLWTAQFWKWCTTVQRPSKGLSVLSGKYPYNDIIDRVLILLY